ncbi:MAG: BrnT family toxin [Lachnospiraceae bacterium]|nr:BrnT family toxin [Lachnospiraceae bacterium]
MDLRHVHKLNFLKYKISFETAAHVFDDDNYIEMYDFEHSNNEDRYIAIGRVGEIDDVPAHSNI